MTQKPNFINDTSGAVTVDWVVLTAGLVGLGLAVMTVVSSGVKDLSTDIDTELSTGDFISTSFGPSYVELDAIPYEGGNWGAIMAAMETTFGTEQMQSMNQAARAGAPQATWESLADYAERKPEDESLYDMRIYVAQVQGVPLDCLETNTCGQGDFPGTN